MLSPFHGHNINFDLAECRDLFILFHFVSAEMKLISVNSHICTINWNKTIRHICLVYSHFSIPLLQLEYYSFCLLLLFTQTWIYSDFYDFRYIDIDISKEDWISCVLFLICFTLIHDIYKFSGWVSGRSSINVP